MRKCCACERWFDHRHESSCPWCGAVPLTLQKLQAENARLRAQVTQLQEHNTAEVERRRKAEAELSAQAQLPIMFTRCHKCGGAQFPAGGGCMCDFDAMKALETRCGELEAQLCGQLVEHPGRKAMLRVLGELRRAKLKYPRFATGPEQGFAVLARESGELADAVVKGDIDGEHGIIREAAQVAAVAIRIIEMALNVSNGRRCGDCGQPNGFEGCEGCRFASDHPLWIPKTAEKRTEASA